MTMTTWQKDDILRVLHENRARLRELGVVSLGLFGSYARGDHTAESDIDFVVELARPSFMDYARTYNLLEDLLDHEVDLALADSLRDELRPVILSEVVYVTELHAIP